MKNFGDIKVGDVVHYCVIKDSEIIQDCVGNIILDGYVACTSNNLSSDRIGLTINKMKYDLNKGYIKDADKPIRITKEDIIYLPKDTNINVFVTDEDNTPHRDLFIKGKLIVSTSKMAIANKLMEIVENHKKKVDEMTLLCSNAKCKSETMRMSASIRLNMAQYEEDEKELTEEEFACIAL